ncbi:MAG: hypothetical protein SPK50_06965 [Mobiluncus porci]|uniref:Uncharacterized protein n=1 Tax=Mobiluncus porci TaxID=2652278 RepID=A0A7K0K106_9ACTO|nr:MULTISPECIES: hypothetical protein [Mobiluncus]MCI6584132.1 hypothetical protein [Mobiluncus sp.]MDD7541921.1 hypothetical protein [Mobiluncus porci]MDY5748854.1 hypothetical protein [Mobiluncus porci]MST49171.1 hypothetical protein [Mobiluncus porci]
MEAKIYKTLSRIVGVVLIVLGIGAYGGGTFDHNFVSSQLEAQGIIMPSQEEIENSDQYSAADKAALAPYYGQKLSNGDQAKAFADNYMAVHMAGSAKRAGVPDDMATFNGIGEYTAQFEDKVWEKAKAEDSTLKDENRRAQLPGVLKAKAEDPAYAEDIKQINALNNLKNNTFFQGNMIRGTLLSAYGWGLLGTVAKAAGIGLIVIGILLVAVPFLVKGKKPETVAATK